MDIAFRVDASLDIGIGHVMRCLTLANALSKVDDTYIRFVCRQLPENLYNLLIKSGHDVVFLDGIDASPIRSSLAHAEWLTVNHAFDAQEALSLISDRSFDWFIVDHYAIDKNWHDYVKAKAFDIKVMVIDDLADRVHNCDILLDQTLGRLCSDYENKVPEHCKLLVGSSYVMLRPEFNSVRNYSLSRRQPPSFKSILISMGGADKDNISGLALCALKNSSMSKECVVTIVMNSMSPHLDEVKSQAKKMPFKAIVAVDVANMSSLMANSDFVIGAAGATSWERCCLGVPSLVVVLADNQMLVARRLLAKNAIALIDNLRDIDFEVKKVINDFMSFPIKQKEMSLCASKITDGFGVNNVIDALLERV